MFQIQSGLLKNFSTEVGNVINLFYLEYKFIDGENDSRVRTYVDGIQMLLDKNDDIFQLCESLKLYIENDMQSFMWGPFDRYYRYKLRMLMTEVVTQDQFSVVKLSSAIKISVDQLAAKYDAVMLLTSDVREKIETLEDTSIVKTRDVKLLVSDADGRSKRFEFCVEALKENFDVERKKFEGLYEKLALDVVRLKEENQELRDFIKCYKKDHEKDHEENREKNYGNN